MHTTPNTANSTQPTLRDLQQVMIRVQIKALETLERLMDDQDLTGNEKVDKAKATERNRQRMSATQTLIHCRAMQRELREKREQSHRIRQDERAAQNKAPHQLATLRRLHKLNPDEYDNPDSPSPLEGEGGDRSQIDRRMRGRPESSDDQSSTSWGAMVGAEGAGHADNGTLVATSHGLRPTARRTQTMPPKPIPTPIGKALAAQIIAVAGSSTGHSPATHRESTQRT